MEIFEVLGGLGRFVRMLSAVLHGYGWSGRALERLLDGLWSGVGRSWLGFGCHVGAQDGSEIWKLPEKCYSRRQKVPQRFLMDFASKISSPGDHKICI